MRCVKPVGRSTRGRSTVRLGVAGGFGISHNHVLAAGRSTERAHDDVTHSGGPGLTSLPTSIADPSAHSSEATTGGSRAGDSFDRGEQGAGSLIHRGARVLMRNMAHETRDGGEPPARTLAAPVVESQAVRMPQSCWPVTCDKGPLSQAVRMPQSCWPVTCDKGPSELDCETCCGSSWTSRSQTLSGPRKVSKHRSTPGITSVEKQLVKTQMTKQSRQRWHH